MALDLGQNSENLRIFVKVSILFVKDCRAGGDHIEPLPPRSSFLNISGAFAQNDVKFSDFLNFLLENF